MNFKRLITHVIPEITFNAEYGMMDCEVAKRYFLYNMISTVFYNPKYVL